MNIILKFVTSYIRTHMNHENAEARNAIFRAINDGITEEFTEDNCPTRIYSTVQWLAENDNELCELAVRDALYRTSGSRTNAAEVAREAILEAHLRVK